MVKKEKTHDNVIEKKTATFELKTNRDIAMDFALKVAQKFDKIAKAIVLFGSSVKENLTAGSDIDIMIIVDDATIKWDMEMTAWYREELGKIIQQNPYKKDIHVNTVRLTTWWLDVQRGDPVAINVIRYGEALIDFAGFFNPQKIILEQGKIR
ncbi:MAG: nucleotidyltransferase domain-containing protein [Nanoarchaeota archaeon]